MKYLSKIILFNTFNMYLNIINDIINRVSYNNKILHLSKLYNTYHFKNKEGKKYIYYLSIIYNIIIIIYSLNWLKMI